MNGCLTTAYLATYCLGTRRWRNLKDESLIIMKWKMMKRENSNRTRIVGLRFTPLEYAELEKRFRASTCRKLSDHIRSHLFNKPIVATYRNQSLDELMEETAVLTSELRAIGNNINQIAKKINTLKTIPDFKGHLYLFEIQRKRLFDKMEEVSVHTQKIAEKWLQW